MRQILATMLIIALLSGCGDTDALPFDPHDARQIEGRTWTDMTGTTLPDWRYTFDRGVVTMQYEAFGAGLSTLQYPYALRADTVLIGGDTHNPPQAWVIYFECHDVVRVNALGQMLNSRFWLKADK